MSDKASDHRGLEATLGLGLTALLTLGISCSDDSSSHNRAAQNAAEQISPLECPADMTPNGGAGMMMDDPPSHMMPNDPPNMNGETPDPDHLAKGPWLPQGWSDEERMKFHHTSQGTATFSIPYEWFVALEQPSMDPAAESPLFIEPTYQQRFGFVPSEPDAELNPDNLPVGFARAIDFDPPFEVAINPNPNNLQKYSAIGLTCAACHTGKLTYQGAALYIDGGPAGADLGAYRDAVRAALGGLQDPARLGRFIGRVLLGDPPTEAQIDGLTTQLMKFFAQAGAEAAAEQALTNQRVEEGNLLIAEGPARLDALARIGTQVFWTQQRRGNPGVDFDDNFQLPNAPVNFPHIWDAPWFDWVQYNGSIKQSMFRNYTQAAGVGALVNLGENPVLQLRSTVDVDHLGELEELLTGQDPFPDQAFNGLRSPKWPIPVLGPIDPKRAAQGAELYKTRCQACHLPATNTPEFWTESHWQREEDSNGMASQRRFLQLGLTPLAVIGTDPTQAENMITRRIQLPAVLGGDEVSYPQALERMTAAIDRSYEDGGYTKEERDALDGYRTVGLRDERGYRPRPLNGIWATPPFLHNGSVPSIYQLLSPVSERAKRFYLGGTEFDPKELGIETTEGEGRLEIDTTVAGNFNSGHEFSDKAGPGVIGPELSHEERMALIEYLKKL